MALFGGEVKTIPYQSPDYSGSVEAARGLAMAKAQGVAGGINQVADYFKQQGEKKKLIKKSDVQIDAALKLFPDLAPTLQGVRDQIKDENISLDERAGIAESVAGLINMGTNQMQAMADYGLKKRQLDIQEGQGIQSALAEQAKLQAEANKPTKLKRSAIKLGDETEVDVLEDDYGNIYDPQTKSRILDVKKFAAGFPLSQVTEQFDASGLPVAYGGEMPTETGDVLPSLARGNVPTLSAGAQAAADIGGAIYPDGAPVEGTPIAGAGDQIAAASQIAAPTVPQTSAKEVQAAIDITPTPSQPLTPRARKINKEGFREFTPEEVVKYGSPGQINTKNDEVKLLSPPVGRSWKVSPDGTVEVIEGAGVGGKAQAAEKAAEEAKKQEKQSTNQMFDMAAQTIEQIPNLPDSPIGAKVGEWFGKIVPGTATGRVAEKLGSINANIAFGVMQNMRKSSPTGAAAGTMTEKEWPLFWQQYGNLSAATNKEDLKNRVQNMSLKMFDAANGSFEERQKALKEGKITPEQNAKVEVDYLKLRNRMKIPESGIPGFSETQLNATGEGSSLFPPDIQSIIDKYTPQPK